MKNNYTFLAIIPARGGSKRLPKKNILNLCGKPLITWSIEAAKKSEYIDEIIVTSDDLEVLEISSGHKVKTIKRPLKLSGDTSTTYEAVEHTIQELDHYDFIVLLQPTSPLRTEKHIDDAITLLINKSADAIVSVTEADHSPLWSNVLPKDGSMKNFIPENIKNIRSQDLDTYFRINGAIYICNTNFLLKNKSFLLTDNIYSFIMGRESSVDIDDDFDFNLAKLLMMKKNMINI
jgi:CMP-N,N'-diacetyllegionaminic acid synthase